MVRTWQQSVNNLLNKDKYGNKSLYHWKFPRGVGVTTFLTEKLVEYLHLGNSVAFISQNMEVPTTTFKNHYGKHFGEKIKFFNVTDTGKPICGTTVDVVIVDGISITSDIAENMMKSLIPKIISNDGHILWIETGDY